MDKTFCWEFPSHDCNHTSREHDLLILWLGEYILIKSAFGQNLTYWNNWILFAYYSLWIPNKILINGGSLKTKMIKYCHTALYNNKKRGWNGKELNWQFDLGVCQIMEISSWKKGLSISKKLMFSCVPDHVLFIIQYCSEMFIIIKSTFCQQNLEPRVEDDLSVLFPCLPILPYCSL